MTDPHEVPGRDRETPPSSATHLARGDRTRSTRHSSVLMLLAAAVAVGGLAFSIGRISAPAQPGSAARGTGASPGTAGTAGTSSMTLTGTIESIDGSATTIRTADGSTITVFIDGATFHGQAAASASDLASGADVQILLQGAGATSSITPAASPGHVILTAADVTLVTP